MLSDIFNHAGLIIFPIIGFFSFAVLFMGILFWVFRKGSARHYKYMGSLALSDENLQTESLEPRYE